jgi:hypothetical protein
MSQLKNEMPEIDLHLQYKLMKKELKLTNADIAAIIGHTADSVKTTTQPKRTLPAWAKGMVYNFLNKSKK